MILDLLVARFSEIDADGFIGVQVDNYGPKAEFGAVEAHHPFGFMSRPRDPDVDDEGNVKLGATTLRLAEGNQSHVIVLGDPRATSKVPALKKGGSAQYGFTGTDVFYALFDGDTGSYTLRTPGAHVDLTSSSGAAVVGTPGAAQNVMLAPDLLTWIAQVNAYLAALNTALTSGALVVVGATTPPPTSLAVGGTAKLAAPIPLPLAVPIQTVILKASPTL